MGRDVVFEEDCCGFAGAVFVGLVVGYEVYGFIVVDYQDTVFASFGAVFAKLDEDACV